jgi:ABC-type phosphate transport system ATPase subunit
LEQHDILKAKLMEPFDDNERNAFATVFQDYKNFAISVFENVMCRECDENDKKIAEKALEQSGAWSKVSTLKYGGDTSLTREFDENGAGRAAKIKRFQLQGFLPRILK